MRQFPFPFAYYMHCQHDREEKRMEKHFIELFCVILIRACTKRKTAATNIWSELYRLFSTWESGNEKFVNILRFQSVQKHVPRQIYSKKKKQESIVSMFSIHLLFIATDENKKNVDFLTYGTNSSYKTFPSDFLCQTNVSGLVTRKRLYFVSNKSILVTFHVFKLDKFHQITNVNRTQLNFGLINDFAFHDITWP